MTPTEDRLMPREEAARLGHETVALLRARGYTAPSGAWVALEPGLSEARDGTIEYPPEVNVAGPEPGTHTTSITIENDTTLRVSRRRSAHGPVAALNFAAATEPGGGFLTGSRAQEENLARSSGLYECLEGRRMYPYHWDLDDPLYSNYVIYSPAVPVFRLDDGTLLDAPWPLSIITSPACYATQLERRDPSRLSEIPGAMKERVHKVLSVAATHGHHQLVLGAWGCGAFGIRGDIMATNFRDALMDPFAGVFRTVVFAITDWSEEKRFIGPFEEAFAPR